MTPLALGYACVPRIIRDPWFAETWLALQVAARQQDYCMTGVFFDTGQLYDGLGQLAGVIRLRRIKAVVVPSFTETHTRPEVLEEITELMGVNLLVSSPLGSGWRSVLSLAPGRHSD